MDEAISNRIEQSVESKMELMKGSLLKDIGNLFEKISESSNSSQLSKLSSLVASEPNFKRKSNEEQNKYNAKVFIKLNEAEGSLEAEKIDDAHSRIVEAKEMISQRQKLIQLADSCELGWRVVQEYESNPLADDSEDEKRMYKAESRANRKLKSERTRKSRGGRTGPYGRSSNSKSPTATFGSGSAGSAQGLKPGLCFQCGSRVTGGKTVGTAPLIIS